MENAELIKALKEDAEWAHANEWETPITLGDHLDEAANALEALQTQFAESQRQLRAAVEDLKLALIDETLDPCNCCEYGRTNHCTHPDGPTCGETGGKNWEWRGQQAGKGDSNG